MAGVGLTTGSEIPSGEGGGDDFFFFDLERLSTLVESPKYGEGAPVKESASARRLDRPVSSPRQFLLFSDSSSKGFLTRNRPDLLWQLTEQKDVRQQIDSKKLILEKEKQIRIGMGKVVSSEFKNN